MEKSTYLDPLPTGEDKIFYGLVAVSVLAHIAFISIEKIDIGAPREPFYEEWAVEADIISNVDIAVPEDSALPDAKEAEEAKVPENMLPQLSKKFAIETAKVKEDEFAEEVVEEKKAKEGADKKEEKSEVKVKSAKNEANKLKMKDALKRLAMEKLRRENKTAKRAEAQKSDPLARLRKELANNKKLNAGGVGATAGLRKQYRGKLRSHIGRFWSVPEAYNLKDAKLMVTIAVVMNERGYPTATNIKRSSGDKVFDEMALKAVKDSVPFPKPPKGSAGEEVLLNFTPRSF